MYWQTGVKTKCGKYLNCILISAFLLLFIVAAATDAVGVATKKCPLVVFIGPLCIIIGSFLWVLVVYHGVIA